MSRRLVAASLLAVASLSLTACGGAGDRQAVNTQPPPYARQGQNQICGEALARAVRRRYVSPTISAADRERAHAMLESIAASLTTTTPVCANRTLRGVFTGRVRR